MAKMLNNASQILSRDIISLSHEKYFKCYIYFIQFTKLIYLHWCANLCHMSQRMHINWPFYGQHINNTPISLALITY